MENTNGLIAGIVMLIIFWGWIPILAIGKAVSMIIEACKKDNKQ